MFSFMMKALSLAGKAVMQTEQKNDGPSLSGNGYDLIFVPTSESLLFLQAFVNPYHLSVTPPLRQTIPSLHVISVLRSSPSNHPMDKNNSSNNTLFYLSFYLSLTLHHAMPSLHVISALVSSHSNQPKDKNNSSSNNNLFLPFFLNNHNDNNNNTSSNTINDKKNISNIFPDGYVTGTTVRLFFSPAYARVR
jgi:hypothetical protein